MTGNMSAQGANNPEIITWNNKYNTGINTIDSQHRQLISLTNDLYHACIVKNDELFTTFKDAMGKMVEYVNFHFNVEIKLMKAINYPNLAEHKKMHAELIEDIIQAANDFKEGKKYVANKFVHTLVDWICSHIAFYDKQYTLFILDQKKKGLLTDQKVNELLS
ncbi:MAG: bacteriohemerythrin [Treponema sp.]|nr:bacteriohemerythrin [Treponema sp.]MCL2244392.1 bacteriohemerythrin [Treponema sp.]